MFCCTLLYVHSSIAIILMGKRELVALLYLSSWCLVVVERLFLAVPWVCLRFVIVVFPDHTHLLFLSIFTVFLKNRNFISKIRSKVTDYAALTYRGKNKESVSQPTFIRSSFMQIFKFKFAYCIFMNTNESIKNKRKS